MDAHCQRGQKLLRQLTQNGGGHEVATRLEDMPPALLPWALHLLSPETPPPKKVPIRAARAGLPKLIDLALAQGGINAARREVLSALAKHAWLSEVDLRVHIDRCTREADGRAAAERAREEQKLHLQKHRAR
jgi:hypothetical protein